MSVPEALPAVIDAHHHLWPEEAISDQEWRPATDGAIRRSFEASEFSKEISEAGVTGSVLMQSVDDAVENDRLFAFARENEFIRGVVAWAPLSNPTAAAAGIQDLIDTQATDSVSKLSGVRCLVGTDPMAWATSDKGIQVFRRLAEAGLTWDTVPITPEQVLTVRRVAAEVPGLQIVIDHLASPPLSEANRPEWQERVSSLAMFENVAIKLSVGVAVLERWDDWDTTSLLPYLEHALESFGPRRSMLASNWPVVLLRTGYQRAWMETRTAVEERLSESERWNVRGGTATRWYGLEGKFH